MFLNKKDKDKLKEYIYSPYGEVLIELEKRRKDKKLKSKVENFLGEDIIKIFNNKPRAILARSIFTPNMEFKYFIDILKNTNLDPLLLEYHGKFVAKNIEKYHLCKLYFMYSNNKKSSTYFESKRI